MKYLIVEAVKNDSELLAEIVSNSFIDIAWQFGLTIENCPGHPSFYTSEKVAYDFEKGKSYFILKCDDTACGCVCLDKISDVVYSIERLSILPYYRNNGFGSILIMFLIEMVRSLDAQKIEIGIIAQYEVLANWYQKFGFKGTEIKSFPHLPFKVLLMECDVREQIPWQNFKPGCGLQ